MKDPDGDQQIQPQPSPASSSASFSEDAGPPMAVEADRFDEPRLRHRRSRMLFGALVGLLMGAVVGTACGWLFGFVDCVWGGTLIGALIGPLGGVLIGTRTGEGQGELVRPDIATIVCFLYGLVASGLSLFWTPRWAGQQVEFATYIFWGSPLAGLLIGALLDRAYEAGINRSRSRAVICGAIAVAACVALSWVLVAVGSRPVPEVVAAKARLLIQEHWQKTPELRGGTIQNVTLVHEGGNVYSGFMEAQLGGLTLHYRLKVIFDGKGFEAEWNAVQQ